MAKKWQDKLSPSPKNADSFLPPGEEPPFVIMLVKGKDSKGAQQWAYAKIPALKYVAFKAAEEQGNYNLADFGEILKSGKGAAPPESIRKQMQDEYGCDENFENELSRMMEEAMAASWNDNNKNEN